MLRICVTLLLMKCHLSMGNKACKRFPLTGRTVTVQDFYLLTKMDDTFIFLWIYIFKGLVIIDVKE